MENFVLRIEFFFLSGIENGATEMHKNFVFDIHEKSQNFNRAEI